MTYDLFCEGDHGFPETQHPLGEGMTITLVDTSSAPEAHLKFNNWTMARVVDAMEVLEALDNASSFSADGNLAYEGETGLIPIGKFDDQSGWIVSESEAKATHDQLVDKPIHPILLAEGEWATTVWKEWMDFLSHTSEHGGFSVH